MAFATGCEFIYYEFIGHYELINYEFIVYEFIAMNSYTSEFIYEFIVVNDPDVVEAAARAPAAVGAAAASLAGQAVLLAVLRAESSTVTVTA